MSTRKIRKSFTWAKKSCDSKYFKSLINILDEDKIPKNTGEFIRPGFTRKKKFCNKLKIKECMLDDFHSGDKYLQIILGRWMITSNCFTNCKNYFAMAMNKWSFFKNDVFIHHMLRNNFFYKKYNSLPLDPVFPIRIVLSNDFLIPEHRVKKTTNFIKEYGYDFFKGKAISGRILNLIMDKHPEITKEITKSHIISRELCLLNEENLYFYKVKHNDYKLYKPYVLISEKSLSEINEIYSDNKYTFEYL
uniref:Uncharacterized protein n=1 Tax=viral metagenome TaxID=1070528 RepID=A0A6C0K484_9ZZZZ